MNKDQRIWLISIIKNNYTMLKTNKTIYTLLMCIIFYSACAFHPPVLTQDGKTYGWQGGVFNGDWEDYYRCALSFMEGEFYGQAIVSLDKAINQRKNDKRMARTYGMHFMDYFPHREKGICYYFLGNCVLAKQSLEYSLKNEKSAKALYYLDLVHKKKMENENQKAGTPLISMNIDNEILTKADPIIISGIVTDKQYVKYIKVHHQDILIEGARQRVDFQTKLHLPEGKHVIQIEAINLLQGKSLETIIIQADRAGPVMHFKKIVPGKSILGVLLDDAKIQLFSVNGRQMTIEKESIVQFHISLELERIPITFIVEDTLGNQTWAFYNPKKLAKMNNKLLFAQNTESAMVSDANALVQRKKNSLPVIDLYGWPDQKTVFCEHVNIEGQVSSTKGISTLLINNDLIHIRSGPIVFFSPSVRLVPGNNHIVIKAKDIDGNINDKQIIIHRDISEIFKHKYRLCLKVTPFEYPVNRDPNHFFQNRLFQYLINSKRFSVILNKLPETIIHDIKFPKIISDNSYNIRYNVPDTMLLGYCNQTNSGREIVSRIIDMKHGNIIAINDVYYEKNDVLIQQKMAQQLVEKILRKIPLMTGYVSEKTSLVPEKWMPAKGVIYQQWPLTLFVETPVTNKVTGQILGVNTHVFGQADIQSESLYGSFAIQVMTNKQPLKNDSIWKVITK
jgi:tetratricopeptide (TPR) repeat protein